MKRSEATLAVLLTTRAALEAVTFTCLVGFLHVAAGGRDPFPVAQAALLLYGIVLALAAVLREARAAQQNVRLVIGLIVAGVVAGTVLLPARDPDFLTAMTRVVGFAILGETLLWRGLSVARELVRWSDARNSIAVAAMAVGAAAILPELRFDHGPLGAFAFVVVVAGGLALSFARSAEELSIAGSTARGGAASGSSTAMALVLGLGSIALAWLMPSLQQAAGAAGAALGDLLAGVIYVIALPFGYFAAWLVQVLAPLMSRFQGPRVPIRVPGSEEQAERIRQAVEETRPFVVGAVEVIVVLVALVVGVLLVDRLTRERRILLPAGASLERGSAGGYGLRAALGGLLPRRAPPRRPPRDDGTPAGAIRLAYWRFLDLAERAGAGWREVGETPAEHAARLVGREPAWAGAAPIVRGFERVRYGDEDVGPADADTARQALRDLRARVEGPR